MPLSESALIGLMGCLRDEAVETTVPNARHGSIGVSLGLSRAGYQGQREDPNDAELLALDDEIAFRQSPVFDEPAGPAIQLSANLIEFPRQLVAPRKARPRYAEGPLREAAEAVPGGSQLRIFEVDAAQISAAPAVAEAATLQWSSIWLDGSGPASAEGSTATTHPLGQPGIGAAPQAASLARRLVSAVINASVILSGFLAFAATFVLTSGDSIPRQPSAPLRVAVGRTVSAIAGRTGLQPRMALVASAVAIGFSYLLYQALYFPLSEATPGMRCARIAPCTFGGEDTTSYAMLRRILALPLSLWPLGLGFLWAALDEDGLR